MPRVEHISELFVFTDSDFVTEAYRNLLLREPDQKGLTYYLGRLSQGHSPESVIYQLAQAPECCPHEEIQGLSELIKAERRKQHPLWKRLEGKTREEERQQLFRRLEIQHEQARKREETLREEARQEQERIQTAAQQQMAALQKELRSAQQELVARERSTGEQIADLHRQERERAEKAQESFAARETVLQQELQQLRQSLENAQKEMISREEAQQEQERIQTAAQQQMAALQEELRSAQQELVARERSAGEQIADLQQQLNAAQEELDHRPKPEPLNTELIRQAYWVVLGREPENESVIAEKLVHENFESLYREMLSSEEFRLRKEQGKLIDTPPLDAEMVRRAYLTVLEREPESEQVILEQIQRGSVEALYQDLLSSEEYRIKTHEL